jgi:hypothetical protein
MTILSKDQDIKTSYIYGGYLIIKMLKRASGGRLSFYEISDELGKNGLKHYRQQFFCLMFLYSTDIISFHEPYVELNK